MEKLSRNNRVVAITKILTETPNKVIGLNKFSELLNAAKSTISEDIVIVRELLEKLHMGRIETISGAAGGIKFIPDMGNEEKINFCNELCDLLMEDGRIVPGNFIYLTDIMYNPQIVSKAGVILSSYFKNMNIDYIVTVETKGIPLAYEMARQAGMNDYIVARKGPKLYMKNVVTTEVNSITTDHIQTLCLGQDEIDKMKDKRVLIVDNVISTGESLKSLEVLVKQVGGNIVGSMAVLAEGEAADRDDILFLEKLPLFNADGSVK